MQEDEEEYFADCLPSYYERFYPQICTYLIRMVHNCEDAHDLTQETFIKVWRKQSQFRGTTVRQFRAWIFSIATTTALSFIRKAKGREGPPNG